MTVADILAAFARSGDAYAIDDPGEWRQGRTLYGGITAMLLHEACRRRAEDLPPLRAAQIAFVGPVTSGIRVTPETLRQGRNVTQMAARLEAEGQLTATGTFIFGRAMDANAVNEPAPEPIDRTPEASPELGDPAHAPEFIERLEQRRWSMGRDVIAVRRWTRLAERGGVDPANALLALGDALPPGSIKAMRRPGPLSSINWSLNLIDPEGATRDGWYLLETRSEHAAEGYTTERLSMWNTDGRLVMNGMQSVAIFG